jgi:hypothetical protein
MMVMYRPKHVGVNVFLIQCNFRILKTLCAFVGDNKTHIFYEMHGEKIKIKHRCLVTALKQSLLDVTLIT